MVGSVINEIEALKEVNQFVWMSLGDLHDIADEMELPTSVQTHLKIEDRAYRAGSKTSVKQSMMLQSSISMSRCCSIWIVIWECYFHILSTHIKKMR